MLVFVENTTVLCIRLYILFRKRSNALHTQSGAFNKLVSNKLLAMQFTQKANCSVYFNY